MTDQSSSPPTEPADPTPPPQGHGNSSATATPEPGKKRNKIPWIAGGAAVGILLLASGGVLAYNGFKEDPGIAACQAIRDQQGSSSSTDSDMTEAEYRETRDLFADSEHEDIREHGTKLVDVLWQVQQLPEGDEMGGIAFIGQLTEHATGLQSACADQGVVFNLLGGATNPDPHEVGIDPSAESALTMQRLGVPFEYQEAFSDGSAPVDWQVTVATVRCGIRLFKQAADNPAYTSGDWSSDSVPPERIDAKPSAGMEFCRMDAAMKNVGRTPASGTESFGNLVTEAGEFAAAADDERIAENLMADEETPQSPFNPGATAKVVVVWSVPEGSKPIAVLFPAATAFDQPSHRINVD